MRKAILLLAASAALVPACDMLGGRRRVEEPVAPREFVSIPTPTPPVAAPPKEVATSTPAPVPPPAKLPEECETIINDVMLTDVLKHRELVSFALQLEHKGRRDEAIVVLREALKYLPENKLTMMELARLTGEAAPRREGAPETGERGESLPGAANAGMQPPTPPPGLDLSGDYYDIVKSSDLSSCARGFKLFVLASRLEGEGKDKEALFAYRTAVALCPEEDGPNATINRQALTRAAALERKIERAAKAAEKKAGEGTTPQ